MMSAHTKVVGHVFMPANFVPFQRLSCVHVHTHVLYCICACSYVCVALNVLCIESFPLKKICLRADFRTLH